MKVHPIPPPRKRSTTSRHDVVSSTLSQSNRQKKLRRLPHIFAKVLELPFHSNADVLIQETPNSLIFTVRADDFIDDVRAQAIEIYPGVTKIVVREDDDDGGVDLSVDELEFDLWRFRLPEETLPEMANAVYVGGELIVTVPKGGELEVEDGASGNIGAGQLVIVQ